MPCQSVIVTTAEHAWDYCCICILNAHSINLLIKFVSFGWSFVLLVDMLYIVCMFTYDINWSCKICHNTPLSLIPNVTPHLMFLETALHMKLEICPSDQIDTRCLEPHLFFSCKTHFRMADEIAKNVTYITAPYETFHPWNLVEIAAIDIKIFMFIIMCISVPIKFDPKDLSSLFP